eukprot:XP_017945882.1 PREDICTED: semaphorin-5B-like [Xenopus tropicalis]
MWLPRPRALTALSLFIFHLSASQVAVETPEKDYCSRREHPILSFQELKPWLSNFTFSDVRDFSQLALDLNRNQLIVGARYRPVAQGAGSALSYKYTENLFKVT